MDHLEGQPLAPAGLEGVAAGPGAAVLVVGIEVGQRIGVLDAEPLVAQRQPVAFDDVEIVAADKRPVRIGITASYLQQRSGTALDPTRDRDLPPVR